MKVKSVGKFIDDVAEELGWQGRKQRPQTPKNKKKPDIIDNVEYTVDGETPRDPDINFTFGEDGGQYSNPGAASTAMNVAGQNARNGMGHSGFGDFLKKNHNVIMGSTLGVGVGAVIQHEEDEQDMRRMMIGMRR